jgi:hypothetical protein
MDGVLTNFENRFKSLNPEHLSPAQYQAKYSVEKFWNFIDEETGVKFWVGMPWMSDGEELWNYIKDKSRSIPDDKFSINWICSDINDDKSFYCFD